MLCLSAFQLQAFLSLFEGGGDAIAVTDDTGRLSTTLSVSDCTVDLTAAELNQTCVELHGGFVRLVTPAYVKQTCSQAFSDTAVCYFFCLQATFMVHGG